MKLFFKILLLVTVVLGVSCSSAKIEKDTQGKTLIIGKVTWDEWQKSAGWDNYTAKDFDIDKFLVTQIKHACDVSDYQLILFGASWCDDSKLEMPKIIEVCKQAGISDKLKIYGVDREKKEGSGTAAKYKIEKVPTLVVLKNGIEVAKVVEVPMKSWDEEILRNLK